MGYLGSKAASGVYQKIIAMMPVHDVYIETHLGGGAVMKNKPKARHSIGIDIDVLAIKGFENSYAVPQTTFPELVVGCAHKFLAGYNFTGRELVYSDPPYLLSTRTSSHRYNFEYTDDDHMRLLVMLKRLPCSVIVSGYPSSMYDRELREWNSFEFQAMTRGGVRTEKVWFNYELGVNPFWHDYAGHDFTDRQRIKRKAERWAKNYMAMPPGERLAVMSAMLQAVQE